MLTKTRPTDSNGAEPEAKAADTRPFDVKTFLSSIGEGRKSIEYCKNESVFLQGDAADAIYYIEKGAVHITVVSEQGKERTIATLGPGDFCGEGCLAGEKFHSASATAITPTFAIKILSPTMIRVLRKQSAFSEMFVAFLLSRKIQIESDLLDQLFNSSEKRLARVLLLTANFGLEREHEVIVPAVSQEALAARVGTTRGRINFFMNKFRDLGLIEYGGNVMKIRSSLVDVTLGRN